MHTFLLRFSILSLFASVTSASTLRVPADYPNIQDALDAGSSGDTISVASGVYSGPRNRELDFAGKSLRLMGEASVIIDCEEAGRGIRFHSGEGPDAEVAHLTIRNGLTPFNGGGISCESNSSPTIRNCRVESCTTPFYGGGIYCGASDPFIVDCVVDGNGATGGLGRGAGILCSSSDPIIEGCHILQNQAYQSGGGIYCWTSSPTVRNCLIEKNEARLRGGGVYCKVLSNPAVDNCVIVENRAELGGGAYCYISSLPTFSNSTFAYNRATRASGGIHCRETSSPTLVNCILWGNSPREVFVTTLEPVLTYCNVSGGWPGAGNIDVDPSFITYREYSHVLGRGSPAIDAGDPSIEDGVSDSHPGWPAGYPDGSRSDMGAYGGPGNGRWLR